MREKKRKMWKKRKTGQRQSLKGEDEMQILPQKERENIQEESQKDVGKFGERLSEEEKEEKKSKKKLLEEVEREVKEYKERCFEEVEKERERLSEKIQREMKDLREQLLKEAKEEVERERQRNLEKLQSRSYYEARRKFEDDYLQTVQADIERRKQFENRLCEDMNQVSSSLKRETQKMIESLEEEKQAIVDLLSYRIKLFSEQMRKNAQNAVNTVVETEWKINKDDFYELLDNFGELQQKLYYKVPEEELGLKVTQIEQFRVRFLKVLNRLGYQHFIPQLGEEYDESRHIIGEPRDAKQRSEENGIVSEVIQYGFEKNGEVCRKAQVVLTRRKDE